MSHLTKMGRVAVDWDGTLVDDERWPLMGDWLPYAPEAIHALAEIFEEVVIWTCRTASVGLDEVTPQDRMAQVEAIEKMLDDIEAPKHVGVWLGAHKPSAQFYIDNRALRFEGDWKRTLQKLLSLKQPTNRKEENMGQIDVISYDDFMAGRFDRIVPLDSVEGHKLVGENPEVIAHGEYGDFGLEEPSWRDVEEWEAMREKESYSEEYERNYFESPFEKALRDFQNEQSEAAMRTFETGATRNVDMDQLDYEGFLSPLALQAFAEYMHEHRFQADGTLRSSDNWQKGIPVDSYMKSLIRHVLDVWLIHRGYGHLAREADIKKALSAALFNTQGLLHETVKADTEQRAA